MRRDPGPDERYLDEERKQVPWTYTFEKLWYPRALWGRLAYDPSTPDALFEKWFAKRYGERLGPRYHRALTEGARALLPLAGAVRRLPAGPLRGRLPGGSASAG